MKRFNWQEIKDTVNRNTGFLIILLIIFIGMIIVTGQDRNRKAIEDISKTAENSNAILHGQDEILIAIKRVTEDGNATAEEKTDTIICMLQVPVEQRTPDTEKNCREKSEARTTASTNASSSAEPSSPSQSNGQTNPQSPSTNTNNSQTPPPNPPSEGDLPLVPEPVENVLNVVPGVNL